MPDAAGKVTVKVAAVALHNIKSDVLVTLVSAVNVAITNLLIALSK